MKIAFRLFLTCCLAAVLIACGGGGGSDVAVAQPPLASLVPVARPVGATIAADASIFRPLKVGSKAVYRGEISESNSASVNVFTSEETQSEALVNGVRVSETRSDGKGEGPSDIFVVNGTIKAIDSVDFAGKGVAERVELIEMRSPVRIDDQWTSFEKRFDDTAFDFDGDGKKDKLDVAIYSRVVGAETISLPNLPDMQALRVDTYVSTRYISSATGLPSVTVELPPVKTWYVAGVGLVRQTITTPTSANTSKTEDLKLTSWDGLTTGIGAMTPSDVTFANGDHFLVPAGITNLKTFAFDQHALVISWERGGIFGLPAKVTKLDLRGMVLESSPLVIPDAEYLTSADSSGVVLVKQFTDIDGQRAIYRLDSDGRLINDPNSSTINIRGNSESVGNISLIGVALDKDIVWVMWSRSTSDFSFVAKDEGVLRAFAVDGRPLGPEIIFGSTIGYGEIVAKNGTAFVSWAQQDTTNFVPSFKTKYATASPAGIIFNREFAPLYYVPAPIALDGVNILAWPGLVGTTPSGNFAGAVSLDKQLQMIRSGPSFSSEVISGFEGLGRVSSPGGRRLTYFTDLNRPFVPELNFFANSYFVGWMDVGDLPLPNTPIKSVKFPFGFTQDFPKIIYFKDRAMLFSGQTSDPFSRVESRRLVTTIVWLKDGNKF